MEGYVYFSGLLAWPVLDILVWAQVCLLVWKMQTHDTFDVELVSQEHHLKKIGLANSTHNFPYPKFNGDLPVLL